MQMAFLEKIAFLFKAYSATDNLLFITHNPQANICEVFIPCVKMRIYHDEVLMEDQ